MPSTNRRSIAHQQCNLEVRGNACGLTVWHSAAASALGSDSQKPTISRAKRSAAMPGWAATRCRICKVLISVGKTQDINRQMSLIDHDPSRIPGNPTEPTGPRLRRLIHHNFIVAFTEEVMHERTPKILGLRSSSIKSLIGTTLEQGLCDFSIQSKQTAWLEYHG